MSCLVAHPRIFRLLMKGKFDVYLLWPFEKKLIFTIVAWFTVCDSTVIEIGKQYGTYWKLGYERRLLGIWKPGRYPTFRSFLMNSISRLSHGRNERRIRPNSGWGWILFQIGKIILFLCKAFIQSHYKEVTQGSVSSRARDNWLWYFAYFEPKKITRITKKSLLTRYYATFKCGP